MNRFIRFVMTGMLCAACPPLYAMMFCLLAGPAAADTTVADYQTDFVTDAPLTDGWQYLWNAPVGWVAASNEGIAASAPIGDPAGYVALQDAGTTWTADGNTSGTDSAPDRYLKLTSTGGHPPGTVTDGESRYVIAAYTVGETGYYALQNTMLQRISATAGSIELYAHVESNPPFLRDETIGTTELNFDAQIGFVGAGQTIYIAIGPGESASNDSFKLDFSVVRLVGEPVAGYRTDFKADMPLAAGWQYLWNAPSGWVANVSSGDMRSGFIGIPSGYAALMDAGNDWTPDGDTSGLNNVPAYYLKLTATGGAAGRHAESSNTQARYAIAAYTVPSDGFYTIQDSYLTKSSTSGDGIEVLVFPGVSGAVFRDVVAPGGTIDFDTDIGYLDAGQTIYVAVGPDGTATSDSFSMDYDIVRYPGDDIETQIKTAAAAGAGLVRIEPGRYYSGKSGRHVELYGISNLTVVADGASLICQTLNQAVKLDACDSVTVSGLRIDYDPCSHIQGTIAQLGTNWLDLRIHRGYPLPTEATSHGIAHEPTGDMILGGMTRYGASLQELEPDLFRYTFTVNVSDPAQIGDYFAINGPNRGIPHALYIVDSYNMTLKDVMVQGAPGFGVLSDRSGALLFDGVSIVPGPTPLLASVPRLRSSNADGIHVTSSFDGVDVKDCRVEFAGDDSIVLTCPYAAVLARPETNVITVVYKQANQAFVTGEKVRLYEHSTLQAVERTIMNVAASQITPVEAEALIDIWFPSVSTISYTAIDLVLDGPVAAGPGDYCASADRSNAGFSVKGCKVRNTRARGILIKASDGIVSNNVIETTWLAGIQMRPDPQFWLEGDYSTNVFVVGNLLNHCGVGKMASGSIFVGTSDEGWSAGHGNLVFENNIISNAPGCSFYISHASGVDLHDNQIRSSHDWMISAEPWNLPIVWLEQANDIRFSGANEVFDPGSGLNTNVLVGTGTNVDGVLGGWILR